MKTKNTLLLILTLQFIVFIGFSQTLKKSREIEIDPRQYMTVKYRKGPSQGIFDTLWNWENRKGIPNQKYNYIDIEGEIEISFDKQALIQNRDFEGTFSLEAEISGINGTRKIEVNPYSEVGIQRIPIGIKSEPPAEISKKLLNMILELHAAPSTYNAVSSSYDYAEKKAAFETAKKQFTDLDKLLKKPGLTIEELAQSIKDLRRYLISNRFINSHFERDIDLENLSKEKLLYYINIIRQEFEKAEIEREVFISDYREALLFVNAKTEVVLNYLNSFENSGEDATKAFFSLVNKDLINYRTLKIGLVDRQNKLKNSGILRMLDSGANLDSALIANAGLILDCTKNLAELSRFRGSPLEAIIKKYAMEDYKNVIKADTAKLTIIDMLKNEERKTREDERQVLEAYFDEIAEEVSIKAGSIIYKKLVYASIDLGKSGASNGEVLNIYVTWILDSKRDSLANSPRLPIGKFFLRETGLKFEVADMFALVKRIDEAEVDQATVSPSNFKGSGGAVLMWTYKMEDRGISVEINNSNYVVKRNNRILNFLEPSIGINVSYLDFSTEKDVEIGTGFQIGLFRNKIFAGYGLNLHMISPKNQSPSYMFIGFSFARIADLFQNSSSVVSSR